jgi:hypothetical protein
MAAASSPVMPAAAPGGPPLPQPVVDALNKLRRPVTIPAIPPVLDHPITVAPLPAILDRAKGITQK